MKRWIIYSIVFLAMLLLAQFEQLKFSAKMANHSRSGGITVLENKTDILEKWDLYIDASTQKAKGFKFKSTFIVQDSQTNVITAMVILEELKKNYLSVRKEELTPAKKFKKLKLYNLTNQYLNLKHRPDKKENVIIHKAKFRELLAKSDKIGMTQKKTRDIGFLQRLIESPFAATLLLLLAFLLTLLVDKFSRFFGGILHQPKRNILAIILILFTSLEAWRMINYRYNQLSLQNLDWFPLLTLETIIGFCIIPLFFLFFLLKKRYFDKLSFVDSEAAKFTFIFFSIFIYSFSWNYVGGKIFDYFNTDSLSYRVWYSPMIPGYALLFASGNLFNNLRKQYIKLKQKGDLLLIAQKSELESQSKLSALQAKINPHFLYNSLNSIANLAKESPEKTEKMALSLSKFYKYSTNRQEENWTSVAAELDLLKTYIAIEQIRFGDRLNVDFYCNDAAKHRKIPRFLLQPLVENAIKYGYNVSTETIDVSIIMEAKPTRLMLQVLDSGSDFSEEMYWGYGLKSVQMKLNLLFPDRHVLDFVNEPEKGVFITIFDK